MFKDIRSWRPIQWFSLFTVLSLLAGIVWGVVSLGLLPMLFVIAIMIGAGLLAKVVQS